MYFYTNVCIRSRRQVISVKIGEIDLKQKTIKVTGKGNKEEFYQFIGMQLNLFLVILNPLEKIYQILKLFFKSFC